MEVSVAAQNAQLTVNNVAIENSSNTISDALENITLNLLVNYINSKRK